MGQSVIEINGTKYDATTGRVVSDAVAPIVTKGHHIDGFVSAKQPLAPTPKTPTASVVIKPRSKEDIAKQRRVHDISHAHTSRVNKSKTLMRSVVKKPTPKLASIVAMAPRRSPIMPSGSYTASANSDIRLNKAVHTPAHSQIKHFSPAISDYRKVEPTVVQNLHVKPAQSVPNTTPPPLTHPGHAQSTSPASKFVDSQLTKVALDQTTEQPKKQKLHKRVGRKLKVGKTKSIALSALAVLLIGGFLAYQNLPTITLAMANREAGITAKIPKEVPGNFGLSHKIGRSAGQVALSYTSRTDDRQFTLTQVKGDTTVQTLKDTIARVSNNQYQTYEAGGITLFLSNNDRVDWISGGMRYNIVGTTGFSPDQIASIASSL